MTEVNVPLLRKAVEWAEVEAAKPWHLSQWDQRHWMAYPRNVVRQGRDALGRFVRGGKVEAKSEECGTCYCIAGWTAAQAGAKPAYEFSTGFVTNAEGKSDTVPDIAQNELGLTTSQADKLFHSGNSITDVRRIAEEIAGERL